MSNVLNNWTSQTTFEYSDPHGKLTFEQQMKMSVLRKYLGELFMVVSMSTVHHLVVNDRYMLMTLADDLQTCEVMKFGTENLVELPVSVFYSRFAALKVK